MAEPTYIYNPLLKKNFQKVTGGSSAESQDIFVSTWGELRAISQSSVQEKKFYNVHLTKNISLGPTSAFPLDLSYLRIDGNAKTITLSNSLKMLGAKCYFYNVSFKASLRLAAPMFYFDDTGISDDPNFVFEQCLIITNISNPIFFEFEILSPAKLILLRCSFYSEGIYGSNTLFFRSNAVDTGDFVCLELSILECISVSDSINGIPINKIALLTNGFDAVTIDQSINWNDDYEKPLYFKQIGAGNVINESYDVYVASIAELLTIATKASSEQKHYRVHLAAEIIINEEVNLDCSFIEIYGHGNRFSIYKTLNIIKGDAAFYNCIFYNHSNIAISMIKIKISFNVYFYQCNFLYAEYSSVTSIPVETISANGECELKFSECIFTPNFISTDPFVVKCSQNFSLSFVKVTFLNCYSPSVGGMHTNKVAVISESGDDWAILDQSVEWAAGYTKPNYYRYGE